MSGSMTSGPASKGVSAAYVIALLFLVNVMNFLDRQLPSILAQSIKSDLGLTDTELGLLGGVAFAVVYATMAFPLARLADRWSAKWVLAGSLAVWSLLTTAGGFAQNFLQLAATRLGVAAGEAGSTPAAHAIISALIPERRRGVAMGVFTLGVPIGIMAGLVLGGWLSDMHSWRYAMIVMGIPGLLLAVLFALTVPNVRPAEQVEKPQAAIATVRSLFAIRGFSQLWIGTTIFGVGAYALFAFMPAFLIRVHGLSHTEVGFKFGLINGVAGAIGAFGGGWFADRVGRGDPGRTLMIPMIGFLVAAPFLAAALFAPTADLALALLFVPYLANVMYVAPCFGVAQQLAPPTSRAVASATLLFGISLVGASLGPFLAGLVSDLLAPQFGQGALRYALLLACFTNLWAALHVGLAAQALRRRSRDA
ncbi:MAG: spinster family MFS transporter [Caulobacterales bacterium]